LTLEELTQIVRDYTGRGYTYAVEGYKLTAAEHSAFYRAKARWGPKQGFHVDIQKGEIIETAFIPHDQQARYAKATVCRAIQQIQHREQKDSTYRLAEVIAHARLVGDEQGNR
jgi:hypothetical protein